MLNAKLEKAMDERLEKLNNTTGAWGMPDELYNFAKTLIKKKDVLQKDVAPDLSDEAAIISAAMDIVDNLCVNSDYTDIEDIVSQNPEEIYGKDKYIQVGDYLVNKLDFGEKAFVFTPDTILDETLEYNPMAKRKPLSAEARAAATGGAPQKCKPNNQKEKV